MTNTRFTELTMNIDEAIKCGYVDPTAIFDDYEESVEFFKKKGEIYE